MSRKLRNTQSLKGGSNSLIDHQNWTFSYYKRYSIQPLIPKVIEVIFRLGTQFLADACCCFQEGSICFCFVSPVSLEREEKLLTLNAAGMFSLVFTLQANSLCINTFRNSNKETNVSRTTHNDWLNDKEMSEKWVQSKETPKRKSDGQKCRQAVGSTQSCWVGREYKKERKEWIVNLRLLLSYRTRPYWKNRYLQVLGKWLKG